eukprot:COSAG06_NODE_2039_length_7765_cov_3.914427_5_plen_70_part_00
MSVLSVLSLSWTMMVFHVKTLKTLLLMILLCVCAQTERTGVFCCGPMGAVRGHILALLSLELFLHVWLS